MARPYTQIKRKTEDALEALINALKGDDLDNVTLVDGSKKAMTFYKGFSGLELETPRLEILCPRADVQIIGSTVTGNYIVTPSVSIVNHYADVSRDEHARLTGVVEDILVRDDLLAIFNNNVSIDDYTVQEFYPTSSQDETNGTHIKTDLNLEMLVTPSTL